MMMKVNAKTGTVLIAVLLMLVWLAYQGGKKSAPPAETVKNEASDEKGNKEKKIKPLENFFKGKRKKKKIVKK